MVKDGYVCLLLVLLPVIKSKNYPTSEGDDLKSHSWSSKNVPLQSMFKRLQTVYYVCEVWSKGSRTKSIAGKWSTYTIGLLNKQHGFQHLLTSTSGKKPPSYLSLEWHVVFCKCVYFSVLLQNVRLEGARCVNQILCETQYDSHGDSHGTRSVKNRTWGGSSQPFKNIGVVFAGLKVAELHRRWSTCTVRKQSLVFMTRFVVTDERRTIHEVAEEVSISYGTRQMFFLLKIWEWQSSWQSSSGVHSFRNRRNITSVGFWLRPRD